MSYQIVSQQLRIFNDANGTPLNEGYIYIGESGKNPETNPINIFWDSSLSIPAVQPIRTQSGYPMRYGTPTSIFISSAISNYSLLIKDKSLRTIYSTLKVDTNIQINSVSTIDDLLLLSNPSNEDIVIVTDINRGGVFIYDSTKETVNDGGTILNGWQRQYNGFVNIKWFGAVGDGITNDSASVQNALNASNEIFVPEGTYVVSGLLIRTNTHFFGIQGKSIFIFPSNSTDLNICMFKNYSFSYSTADNNIIVEDLVFNGNNILGTSPNTYFGCLMSFINVTNSTIRNCRFTNNNYQGFASASCSNLTIENNEFDNLGYKGSASSVPINDNFGSSMWISSLSPHPIAKYISIINNYIHNNYWHGIHFNGAYSEISSNIINDVKEAGIFLPCDHTRTETTNVISKNYINYVALHSVSAHGIEGGSYYSKIINNHIQIVEGFGIVDINANKGCIYSGNKFNGCGYNGGVNTGCLGLVTYESSQRLEDLIITNNIFDANAYPVKTQYGIYFAHFNGTTNYAKNILVADNIFTGDFTTAPYVLDDGALSTGYTIQNNVNAKSNAKSQVRVITSSAQSIAATTWTKAVLNSEMYDLTNDFDSSTYKYMPKKAGYYNLSATLNSATSPASISCSFYKNGVSYSGGQYSVDTDNIRVNHTDTVYLNGTTDYIELYAYSSTINTYTAIFNAFIIQEA